MSIRALKFYVKYTAWDYAHVIAHNINHELKKMKQQKNMYDYWVLKIIKPFVIFFFVLKAKFGKLKFTYTYELNHELTVIVNSSKNKVSWTKFASFTETSKAVILNKDVKQGDNGQVVFPKRIFTNEQLDWLFNILKANQVNKGEIDLNVAQLSQ